MYGPTGDKLEVSVLEKDSLVPFIAQCSNMGRSAVEGLVELGAAYLNASRVCDFGPLRPRDVLRVHLRPRRFATDHIDWPKQIVSETADYVVVNKPGGIPVHPTCDNASENVICCLERSLGIRLWITHRLDIETTGVMVLAKTHGFASFLSSQFRQRQIEKEYLCYTEQEVPPGRYVNYICTKGNAPYAVSNQPAADLKSAELNVIACAFDEALNSYRTRIVLITGRHHQIRSQLAALGAPIVGDLLYGSKTRSKFVLHCERLKFRDGGDTYIEVTAGLGFL